MAGQFCAVAEGLMPAGGMALVQLTFAGMNIFYKLAINDGMDMRVLIAYRFIFATAFLGPLAFFRERKNRPKMTWKVWMLALLSGLFGCALTHNLYISSLKLTSTTFSSATTNLIPTITFILAVSFRFESLGLHNISGQAKILGTLVGIGGTMVLTFYKGVEINLCFININLLKSHSEGAIAPHQESNNHIMGSLLAVASCVCYSIWLIIQAKMMKVYPCHHSSMALMSFIGAVLSSIYAFCIKRDLDYWRLGFDIRLLATIYSGVVASGLILIVLMWCINKKGPLFASIFTPLMLVIVALLSSLLLNEKLHLGTMIGAALIIIGLYIVLWGKGREAVKAGESPSDEFLGITIVSGATSLQQEFSGSHVTKLKQELQSS